MGNKIVILSNILVEDCINKLKTQSEMAAIERGIAIELM